VLRICWRCPYLCKKVRSSVIYVQCPRMFFTVLLIWKRVLNYLYSIAFFLDLTAESEILDHIRTMSAIVFYCTVNLEKSFKLSVQHCFFFWISRLKVRSSIIYVQCPRLFFTVLLIWKRVLNYLYSIAFFFGSHG
jgi:hypothetical protein